MNSAEAIERLNKMSAQDKKYVYSKSDLRVLFNENGMPWFDALLTRLVNEKVLTRALRGIYVFEASEHFEVAEAVEHIIMTMRRGHLTYSSYEYVLSEYSVISQIPMIMTIATTGREGRYSTSYGGFELTHVTRTPEEVEDLTIMRGPAWERPLPTALPQLALDDLKRAGRNLHLVDMEMYQEALEDIGAA